MIKTENNVNLVGIKTIKSNPSALQGQGSLDINYSSTIMVYATENLVLHGDPVSVIADSDLFLTGFNNTNISTTNGPVNIDSQNGSINLTAGSDIILNGDNNVAIGTGNGNLVLGGNTYIQLVAPYTLCSVLRNQSLTTTEILALPAVLGTQVFNSTIGQMFFYQKSPISGLVNGWYNCTGNIKL